MKKKLISVLLTLAVAGTMLAGCGSSKADDTKSEADSSTEKKPGPHPASRIRKGRSAGAWDSISSSHFSGRFVANSSST